MLLDSGAATRDAQEAAGTRDSVELNKRNFVRFQQDVIVNGDFSALPEVFAPEVVVHRVANTSLRWLEGTPLPDGPVVMSHETFSRAWRNAVDGRTDHLRVIDEIHGTADVVWARWTIEWTHDSTIHGIPPTGRRIRTTETGLFRFDERGRMVEGWFMADPLELFEQLGATVTVTPGSRPPGGLTDDA